MRDLRTRARCALLLGGLLTGCSAEIPIEWTLDAEVIGSIGSDPQTSDEALFEPKAVGFDAEGRIYVLDSGNHRVQVFDADGGYLATRGAPGQGPGELQGPEDMWVFPDGELAIADSRNQRIERFGAGGAPLPGIAVDYVPIGIVGTGSRVFVVRLPTAAMVFGPEESPLVHSYTRDGDPRASFVAPEKHPVGMTFFLANTLRIARDPAGGIAITDMHVWSRVRRYNAAGQELDRFGVLYKADAWAPLERLPRDVTEDSYERIARTSLDVRWDPGQSLFWVLAGYTDKRADGTWVQGEEVYRYSPDGTYRGTIHLGRQARRVAPAPDGTLWIVDNEDVLHRYRVTDPEVGG